MSTHRGERWAEQAGEQELASPEKGNRPQGGEQGAQCWLAVTPVCPGTASPAKEGVVKDTEKHALSYTLLL